MNTERSDGRPVRIIACGVFKPAIEYLGLEEKFPQLRITYLESNLHLRPLDLQRWLVREFDSGKQCGERLICLYGNCVAGIDDLCREHGVLKVPGDFCHEILLGPSRFQESISETAGIYFMEREVITRFDEHCRIPLELDDEKMKAYCFEHYQKLLYVHQPADEELTGPAAAIAEFLNLVLDVCEADYSYLEDKLLEYIAGDQVTG